MVCNKIDIRQNNQVDITVQSIHIHNSEISLDLNQQTF